MRASEFVEKWNTEIGDKNLQALKALEMYEDLASVVERYKTDEAWRRLNGSFNQPSNIKRDNFKEFLNP